MKNVWFLDLCWVLVLFFIVNQSFLISLGVLSSRPFCNNRNDLHTICIVQCDSYWLYMPLSTWNVVNLTKELNFFLLLNLIYFNENVVIPMWPIATRSHRQLVSRFPLFSWLVIVLCRTQLLTLDFQIVLKVFFKNITLEGIEEINFFHS